MSQKIEKIFKDIVNYENNIRYNIIYELTGICRCKLDKDIVETLKNNGLEFIETYKDSDKLLKGIYKGKISQTYVIRMGDL